MTQVSANTLTYDQLFLKLKEYYDKQVRGKFASNQEKIEEYKKLLSDIQSSIGQPMTKFDPVIKGEPPSSIKFNKFSSSITDDANLVSKQVDYLNAKIVNAFNLFNEEIESEKKYVERISSKAKILQMYSGAPSEDLIYLGDTFDNADQVDINNVAIGSNPLIENGILSLPISNVKLWPTKTLSIDVKKSNGFYGNNHQGLKGQDDSGISGYTYLYKTHPTISSMSGIADGNPLTYFEYEGLNVDRSSNTSVDMSTVMEEEFHYRSTKLMNPDKKENELLNWSNFNMVDTLKLTVVINGSSADFANNIVITPYFGSCKFIKVTSIRAISPGGKSEDILNAPIYIGTSMIPTSSQMLDSYFYNRAIVKFSERRVQKFEIDIEQSEYQDIDILHSYWSTNYPANTSTTSPFINMTRFNPKILDTNIYESVEYDLNKIVPDTAAPNKFKEFSQSAINLPVKVKKRERKLEGKVIVLEVVQLNKVDSNWIADPVKKFYYLGFENNAPIATFGIEDGLRYTDDFKDIFKDDNGKYFSDTDTIIYEIGIIEQYLQKVAESDYFPTINSFKNEDLTEAEVIARSAELQASTAVFEIFENMTHLINLNVYPEDQFYINPAEVKSYTVPLKLVKEKYTGKRKAIGLRDVEISYEKYASKAEMVSTPFNFNTQIESLMLDVSSNIDNNLSNDIIANFYVSLNNSNWISISPIQLSTNGTAEVLVFNKNLPVTYQLPGIAYLNYPEVPQEIKTVRVKIEMAKSKNVNSTPIIHSYKLIAKVKNQ